MKKYIEKSAATFEMISYNQEQRYWFIRRKRERVEKSLKSFMMDSVEISFQSQYTCIKRDEETHIHIYICNADAHFN